MSLSFSFPLFLVVMTFLCGIIWLMDVLFFERKRKELGKKMPIAIDYGRAFFPVFLIVLIIRSFIAQPYKVPTGSLEPTILPGDFIVVSQFSYGLRLPVLNTKILTIQEPKKGDIAVFRFPADPRIDYIKRVIGVPGDHIVYKNKTLYINDQKINQTFIKEGEDLEPTGDISSEVREETIGNVKHDILVHNEGAQENGTLDITVPKGMYFMMGDNRDNSADSRFWGFVPEENLVGKGLMIWMSWDSEHHRIRWNRIGHIL